MSIVTGVFGGTLSICLWTLFSLVRSQDVDFVYCSGVAFISDNEGEIADGAIDTGLGVYLEDTDCKWVIKPTANDVRPASQKRVVLSFDYMTLESGFDFVRVYETNPAGKLLGVFTGRALPPTVVSTTDVLYVQFQTDGTGQQNGFKARWHTTGCPNDCGSRGSCVNHFCFCDEGYFGGDCSSNFCLGTKRYTTVVGSMMDHFRTLDEEGELNVGDLSYQNNLDCRWVLKPLQLVAPFFTMNFLLMDTEVGRDILYIYDGGSMNAPLLAQVSGTNLSMPMLDSTAGELFVRFVSDKVKRRTGVYASWDTIQECGGEWGFCNDGSYDAFTQVNRPNNGYCWDTANDPPEHDKKGRCICTLSWYGGDCSFNYCLGSKVLTSRIGSLMDHHDVQVNGTMLATGDYKPSSYCRWYIQPNVSVNFIVATIEYFDLEEGSDFLKVYDGNGFANKTILMDQNHKYVLDGVMTGPGIIGAPTAEAKSGFFLTSGPKFFSTTPNLLFQFRTDVANAQPHRGFRVNYEGVYCAGRLELNAASGTLTDGSPEQEMYYPYTLCAWHILPDVSFFLTNAAVLEIEVVSVNVWKDTLELYEGGDDTGPVIQSYRGKVTTSQFFTLSGRDAFVRFYAGCSEATCERGFGWKLRWSIRQNPEFCQTMFPTTLTSNYADIYPYTPGTSTSYRNNENCTWYIDVPGPVEELTITIRSMDLAVEYSNPDYVDIFAGHNPFESHQLLQRSTEALGSFYLRGMISTWTLYGTGKAMIRFVSNNRYQGVGFNIAYEAVLTSSLASTVVDTGATGASVIATAGLLTTLKIVAKWVPYCQPGMTDCLAHSCGAQETLVQAGGLPTLNVCRRTTAGANFTLVWQYGFYGTNTPNFEGSMVGASTVQTATSTYVGNGTYALTYTPKYVGQIAATVSLYGVPLGSSSVAGTGMSTLTMNVLPAYIEPTQTYAYDVVMDIDPSLVGGMSGGKAGLTYQFKIKTFDVFGNEITSGESRWTNAFTVRFDSGSVLRWGSVADDGNGLYTVTFNIDHAASYQCHVMVRTGSSYVAIQGSPFTTVIERVPCPKIGDPTPCNDHGTCSDSGVCSCETGWDGEYCETELAAFLRMAIILENATILALCLTAAISIFWRKCVVEKQMFERLQYEDIEEDW